jgi:hypothetical protein
VSDQTIDIGEAVSLMTPPSQIYLKLVFDTDGNEEMVLTRLENSSLSRIILMVWRYPDQDCLVTTACETSHSAGGTLWGSFITLLTSQPASRDEMSRKLADFYFPKPTVPAPLKA